MGPKNFRAATMSRAAFVGRSSEDFIFAESTFNIHQQLRSDRDKRREGGREEGSEEGGEHTSYELPLPTSQVT